MARPEVEAVVDRLAPSGNLFYALRIDGRFTSVVTRTVPIQTPPNPPLTEVTATEPITTFTEVAGTLVGFRTPDYAQGIGIAGHHLHFLTSARDGGGHVLDFTLSEGTLRIGAEADLHLHLCLPQTREFLAADLAGHDSAEIDRAENAPPERGQPPPAA